MAKTDLPPLRTPSAIAKFAAKVILEKLTTPSVASLIMELGLPAAQDFYERVWKKKKISEQIAEVESVAQLDPLAAVEEADAAINEVARENHLTLTDKQKAEARAYLAQLPSAIRHTLKRPEDPSGKTATQEIVPKSPQALVELLPKPSRFKAGDRVPDSTLVLQELLGVGGFGEVWRAKNPNLKSAPMVAVKFCLHPSAIDSLQRERDLLDRLQSIAPHPGIVRLRNVNLENATPWLEYDLIEGGTLASHIRQTHQKSPIDFNQITIDFTHIVEPITHAHQNGIIHRDLKPANVLVTRGKDGVEFRITDFGIGAIATEEVKRQAEQAMTQAQFTQSTFTGTFTPLYASPEQKRGEDADVRDDIYALGVIWLQMLTGNMAKDRLGRGDRKKFEAGGMDASAIDLLDAMLQPDRADRPEKVAFKIVEPKPEPPKPASKPSAPPATREPEPAPPKTKTVNKPAEPTKPAPPTLPAFAAHAFSLAGHTENVTAVAMSRDGKFFATGSDDKSTRIWNLTNGQLITTLIGHEAGVSSAAFSYDASRIVTGSKDCTIRLWDAKDGKCVEVLPKQAARVDRLVFSPRNKRLASKCEYKEAVHIWNDQCKVESIINVHQNGQGVRTIQFSNDESKVLTASDDGTAKICDASSGKLLVDFKGHQYGVPTAEFSPDNRFVVTAGFDQIGCTWDAKTGKAIHILKGHTELLVCAEYNSDGTKIVTASKDNSAIIWEAATGKILKRLAGHTDDVHHATFSPNGLYVVTCSSDKIAKIWNAITGQLVINLTGHTSMVYEAMFTPDGKKLVTRSFEKYVHVWNLNDV